MDFNLIGIITCILLAIVGTVMLVVVLSGLVWLALKYIMLLWTHNAKLAKIMGDVLKTQEEAKFGVDLSKEQSEELRKQCAKQSD